MAQVTGAMSSAEGKVWISTDGSAWTDISGAVTTIEPDGGTRMTGETYTLDGDSAIVTRGKSEPFECAFSAVYTEGASDLFRTVYPIFTSAAGVIYMRWSPKGGQTGELMFTCGAGVVSDLVWPALAADTGDPVMTGFTFRGPAPTMSVVA